MLYTVLKEQCIFSFAIITKLSLGLKKQNLITEFKLGL